VLVCALSAGLLFSQAQKANVTTMCKVHTDFNAIAAIVGSLCNGTSEMYLHGWTDGTREGPDSNSSSWTANYTKLN